MISEIPIDVSTSTADGEITLDVELDGLTYTLQLSYAPCSLLWYLSIFLPSNSTLNVKTPITQGVALVTASPLLFDTQVEDRPAGELIMSGDHDATRDDLGSAVKLLYYDAAEVASL